MKKKTAIQEERDSIANDIPKSHQPHLEDKALNVPCTLTVKRHYTSDQEKELARMMGVKDIGIDRMAGMAELGRHAKELGVIEVIKGSTLMGQSNLVHMINKCAEIATSSVTNGRKTTMDQRLKAVALVARSAQVLASLNKSAVDVDAKVVDVVEKMDDMRRQSFQPGMAINIPKSP